MDNPTTIRITKTNRDALRGLGKMGDTYNDVVCQLIQEYSEKK